MLALGQLGIPGQVST